MTKNQKKTQNTDKDVFMQISSVGNSTKHMLKVPKQYKPILNELYADTTDVSDYHNSHQMMRFFCELFTELDYESRSNFEVLLNSGIARCNTLSDLVTLILSMHKYYRLVGINSRGKLGRYYIIANGFIESTESIPRNAFDNAEKIGREIKQKEKGEFYQGDYIGRYLCFEGD